MRFLPFILLIFLDGCFQDGNATTTIIAGATPGTSYPIEKLFTVDGCTIYRLTDAQGRTDAQRVGYFSVCPQVACPALPAPTICPTPKPKQHKLEDTEK